MPLESRGDEWRVPISSERTAPRTAIAAHALGFRVRARFQLAVNGADPADPLLQFLLGVAVGLIDGLGSFADVVTVAPLVGDIWQGCGDGTADRGWAIGDNAHHGHAQRLSDSVNQVREVILRGGQQTTSQENLGGETSASNPQHLMPHIRLQAIQGQDEAALGVGDLLQTKRVSQRERYQCIVAFQKMLHRAGSTEHPAAPQLLMHLGAAPVVGLAP